MTDAACRERDAHPSTHTGFVSFHLFICFYLVVSDLKFRISFTFLVSLGWRLNLVLRFCVYIIYASIKKHLLYICLTEGRFLSTILHFRLVAKTTAQNMKPLVWQTRQHLHSMGNTWLSIIGPICCCKSSFHTSSLVSIWGLRSERLLLWTNFSWFICINFHVFGHKLPQLVA